MYMIGSVFVGIFGFIYFALLDTRAPALIFIAIALSLLPAMTCYGPQAALIAESFSPRLRYSGASLGYQLASIIAGGPSPFYRYGAICDLWFELSDRPLFPRLRGDRSRLGVAVDRLHQQGRLAGIPRRVGQDVRA